MPFSHDKYIRVTGQPAQRSEGWFALRNGVCTGSRWSSLYFNLKSPQAWNTCWNRIFAGEEEVFDDRANKAMAWGTEHEDDAVKVIIDTIPGCTFYESPFIPHPDYDWLAASPDGLIKVDDDNGHWEANVEIKCVGTNCLDKGYEAMAKELKKKTKPSPWYMSQIHMEMAVQNQTETLFVMWTPLFCRMFRIQFDHDYYTQMLDFGDAFRKRIIPWHVMESKYKAWKRASWAVANKQTIWKDIPLHYTNHSTE